MSATRSTELIVSRLTDGFKPFCVTSIKNIEVVCLVDFNIIEIVKKVIKV